MVTKTYYKTKDYCKVKFSVNHENAEVVEILGLNHNWQESVVMKRRKDGAFTVEVNLPKDSTHEFRYRVNQSEWLNEPDADRQQKNPFGTANSIIEL